METATQLEEKLSNLQKAIEAVEQNGQSYTADGKISFTRADLKTLYDREETLIQRLNNLKTNGRGYRTLAKIVMR
ncbi:MAG: hypothetical protein ACLRPD_11980 [Megamonas funiformis]|uniref:hypothetical protein n=1 Tax=Megamonas TaxID=158846 RepID=UPI00205ABB7E|nr:hypothetical protein [Megamonas sp.]DAE88739.1 MAG TPA: hypothetical protein [Caudoviricetes sp.]DAF22533.1 MAG TPA: hypothetical protein [Caudoviricetes sp.]